MRLASFNALHGRALDGSPAPVDLLAEACSSLGADVLGLQEVDRGQPRSGGVDQTAAVARAMEAAAWRFAPALVGEPGGRWRTAVDGDGQTDGSGAREPAYGVGLVSRLEVRSWHVVRLPPARGRSPVYVPGRRGFVLLADEPRAAVAAVVEGPSGPLVVATCHLSFVPGWNAVQLRRLTAALAQLALRSGTQPALRSGTQPALRSGTEPGHPSVLLGDMNLPGRMPAWVSGWRGLARARTFPADRPRLQIDHALGRGDVPPVTGTEARHLPLSDHRALVVDM